MIKRILPIALLSAMMYASTGCKSGGGNSDFKKLNGLSYKIVKDVPGKPAKIGEIIQFHIQVKADTLTPGQMIVLQDSRTQGRPFPERVDSVVEPGNIKAVFPYLSAGDSAIVEILVDTILKSMPPGSQPPGWMKSGRKINFHISVVSVKSMEEFQKDMQEQQAKMQEEMKAKMEAQKPIDEKLLQEYFAKNSVKAEKSATGMYYSIMSPGSGPVIAKGKQVSVMYTGRTLDGTAFDSNVDTAIGHHGTAPLEFVVGRGMMIPGFDEGVTYLKKGSKATLYLPSSLAYGPQSPSPLVPANSILMFDVEVKDVKDAPAAPEGMMPVPAETK